MCNHSFLQPRTWSTKIGGENGALSVTRKDAYIDFFVAVRKEFNARFPNTPIKTVPTGRNYLRIGAPAYPKRAGYHIGFTRDELFRVEVTFDDDDDKSTFDSLIRWRSQIESELGERLDWARLHGDIGRPHRLRSQVSVFYPGSATIEDAEYSDADFIDWVVPMADRFMRVMDKYLTPDRLHSK